MERRRNLTYEMRKLVAWLVQLSCLSHHHLPNFRLSLFKPLGECFAKTRRLQIFSNSRAPVGGGLEHQVLRWDGNSMAKCGMISHSVSGALSHVMMERFSFKLTDD